MTPGPLLCPRGARKESFGAGGGGGAGAQHRGQRLLHTFSQSHSPNSPRPSASLRALRARERQLEKPAGDLPAEAPLCAPGLNFSGLPRPLRGGDGLRYSPASSAAPPFSTAAGDSARQLKAAPSLRPSLRTRGRGKAPRVPIPRFSLSLFKKKKLIYFWCGLCFVLLELWLKLQSACVMRACGRWLHATLFLPVYCNENLSALSVW